MGLITKTVKMRWGSRNKRHFENLGYVYTKMGDEFEVKVEDLTKGSKTMVECMCDNCNCYLHWSYKNYNRWVKNDNKTYCNKCGTILIASKQQIKTRLKYTKSFKEWCMEHNKQNILDRWDYKLNDCNPDEITYGSSKLYWFKCDKCIEHKSELRYLSDFVNSHDTMIECKQCNSIAQWFIDNDLDINDYWDWDKNKGLDPWEISRGSGNKIWIKYKENDYCNSFDVRCVNFVNRKVYVRDSLGQYIINVYGKEFLNMAWSNKNNESPFEYTLHTNKKVWWKCLDCEHDDYYRTISNSVKYSFRCPNCTKKRTESMLEEKVRLYLETLGYTILHEHNCTLKPRNPKTNYILPYDNEVVELKLLIEVHGEQHYNSKSFTVKHKCSEKEAEQRLHYLQLKDRYKRIYAIQNGYYYLEIPYWTIRCKKDTYKKLIDDKINEIENKNY